MYAVNWLFAFWNSLIQWELFVNEPINNRSMNLSDTWLKLTNCDLTIDNLSWPGERPLAIDSSGTLIEATSTPGGTNFDITDDFVTDTHISDGYTFRIGGRPGSNVLKTIWASPTELEIRLEWGSSGQVVGYDSQFGAGWVNGILTYSDVITPLANSPLVITHNWWTTKVQVSVYDTVTGEEVTPTVVSRDNDNVRITMPTSDEIEIVIIWFN